MDQPSTTPAPKRPRRTSRRGYTGVPRDPDRTLNLILDAATAEFTAKGLGGARVDAIAERAGINKRMLYHYFGDKNGLYLAALEAAYRNIRAAERALPLDPQDPESAIRQICGFTWGYFFRNPEFLALLSAENLERAANLKQLLHIADINSGFIRTIAELLEIGTTRGLFRPGTDATTVYVTIVSLCSFYLSNRWTLSTVFKRELETPEQMKAWGAHIEDVMMSYLKNGATGLPDPA